MAKISKGNSKIGRILNVSHAPIHACKPGAPCVKDCYALKAYRQHPATRAAWTHNHELAKNNPDQFFGSIRDAIRPRTKFFRWHVSGDILSAEYFQNMIQIAIDRPSTKFLCFTKRPEFISGDIPNNLTVVFSAWPGHALDDCFPIAYYQDDTETRAGDAYTCPGSCKDCRYCWSMRPGMSVVFHKH